MVSYFLHYPDFLDRSESGKIFKLKLKSHSAQTLDELHLSLMFLRVLPCFVKHGYLIASQHFEVK